LFAHRTSNPEVKGSFPVLIPKLELFSFFFFLVFLASKGIQESFFFFGYKHLFIDTNIFKKGNKAGAVYSNPEFPFLSQTVNSQLIRLLLVGNFTH